MRWSVLLCVLVLLTSLNYWKIWSWPSSKCQVYSRLLRSEPILGIRSSRQFLWFENLAWLFFSSVKYGFCSGWFSSTLRGVMSCTWLDRSSCYTQALHRLKGNCYITCLRLLSLCSQEATLDVDCESGFGAASVKLDALNVSLSLSLSLILYLFPAYGVRSLGPQTIDMCQTKNMTDSTKNEFWTDETKFDRMILND